MLQYQNQRPHRPRSCRPPRPHPDENGYRNPKEQRPRAVRSGTFREVEIDNSNPDAEPVITVCTDNNCPVHDPRAAARAAEHPGPVMTPAREAETEEQAEERRQQYEAQRKAHDEEEERRAEERKQQFEQEQKEMEAEAAKRDKLRKKREATFERIVAEAPPVLTPAQLRVILRALVNLDPYSLGTRTKGSTLPLRR